jgi:hypothetical protein
MRDDLTATNPAYAGSDLAARVAASLAQGVANGNYTILPDVFQYDLAKRWFFTTFYRPEAFERGPGGATFRFDNSFKTNAYAACPLFTKPKQHDDDPPDGDPPPEPPEGQQAGPPADLVWAGDDDEDVDYSQYDVMVGIDPGMKNISTFTVADRVPQPPGGGPDVFQEREREQGVFTSKWHRTQSQIVASAKWQTHLREECPRYTQIISAMPTMKTANQDRLKMAIKYRLQHFYYLFIFGASKPFLKWRFTTYRFSKKSVAAMAGKFAALGPRGKVLLGMGDWSQRDGFRCGHPKVPQKRLMEELKKRLVKVVMVREYKTSKKCSHCKLGGEACMERAPLAHRQEDGQEVVKACYDVLRCPACNTLWSRDINASRNIHFALLAAARREARPAYLT